MNAELRIAFNKAIEELTTSYQLTVGGLTKEQFAEALRQAIACGDFKRLVLSHSLDLDYPKLSCSVTQQVVYLPYAREQELLAKIKTLEERLHEIETSSVAG